MFTYIGTVLIYIKKSFFLLEAKLDLNANIEVFKAELEQDVTEYVKRIDKLQDKKLAQEKLTQDEELELMQAQEIVEQNRNLKKMKIKAQKEIMRSEEYLDFLREKVTLGLWKRG